MKRLHTRTLHEIPDDFDVPGMFLEDDSGKRYPAKQVIAAKLLKQGRHVTLLKQGVNYYWVGSRFDKPVEQIYFTPPKPRQVQNSGNVPSNHGNKIAAYYSGVYDNATDAQKGADSLICGDLQTDRTPPSLEVITSVKTAGSDTRYHLSNHNPRRAFRDDDLEARVQYIQKRINQLVQSADQQISLRSARKLMIENTYKDILKVIRRVEQRQYVENPVGLIIVILRSDKKRAELKQLMRLLS